MPKRSCVLIFLIAGLLFSMALFAGAKGIDAKADTLSISLKSQPGEPASQYTREGPGTLLAQRDDRPFKKRMMESRGKQAFDKRQDIRERDSQRDMDRELKQRRRD